MDYKKYIRHIDNIYHVHFYNKNGLSKNKIREICSAYGKILSIVETSRLQGMRFVTFKTEEEAINCVKGLQDNNFIKLLPETKQSDDERNRKDFVSSYNETATNEKRSSTMSSEKFVTQNLTHDNSLDEIEWEKFAKIDKDGNYSLHFYENSNLSQKEIEDIFSPYGNVTVTFGSKNDVDTKLRFVKYQTVAEVVKCIKGLQNNNRQIKILPQKHKNLNVTTEKIGQKKFKKKQTTELIRNSKEHSDQAKEEQENTLYSVTEEDVPNKMLPLLQYKVPSLISDKGPESISHTEVEKRETNKERSFQVQSVDNLSAIRRSIIPLQGWKPIPVIVANIHENYSGPYILHLLEKYKPVAVTSVETSKSKEIRYCTVYVNTVEDAVAIEKTFDNFCLSEKNLIVLQQSTVEEKLNA